MRRVESLDYLRGLMATSVMSYHYVSWSVPKSSLGGEYLLGKLGIYAVSIFYILSGLTLFLVYDRKINSLDDVISFLIKRVARILPLFWLAITVSLAFKFASHYISNKPYDFPIYTAILNYSLTFGVFDHAAYLTTGAWSIGNEVVFYLMLPIVFLFSSRYRLSILFFFVVSVCIASYFSFHLLDGGMTLSSREQWVIFINPFNQLFLFAGGLVIGKYGHLLTSVSNYKPILAFILMVAFGIFYFYPTMGDKIDIVTGYNRIVLSFLCLVIVLGIYILDPSFRAAWARILGFFGESCYSIYLLHPLVCIPIVFLGSKLGVGRVYSYGISALATLAVSWLTFKYLESPLMNYGKSIVKTFRSRRQIQPTENAPVD